MTTRKTERQLWDTLQRALQRAGYAGGATRFEVTTAEGVSDVEYVLAGWHGWVELKVSPVVRLTSLLRFGSPFTAGQCAWLLAHHNPRRHLRSWLLIGMYDGRGAWAEFMLLPAPATPALLRSSPTLAIVRAATGVGRCAEIECVVDRLTSSIADGKGET